MKLEFHLFHLIHPQIEFFQYNNIKMNMNQLEKKLLKIYHFIGDNCIFIQIISLNVAFSSLKRKCHFTSYKSRNTTLPLSLRQKTKSSI